MQSSPVPSPARSLADNSGPATLAVATTSQIQTASQPFLEDSDTKAAPAFFSCLRIPVEGATPVEPDSSDSPQQATASDSKRTPRKSKTDAITAMEKDKRASSVDPTDSEQNDILAEKYRSMPPIPVSPALDLASVRTSSIPGISMSHTHRPFGLQDCPEFFPTVEEFKDPMAYVRSISDKAKEYGICKVIPPEGWKMPFVTDTEVIFVASFSKQ